MKSVQRHERVLHFTPRGGEHAESVPLLLPSGTRQAAIGSATLHMCHHLRPSSLVRDAAGAWPGSSNSYAQVNASIQTVLCCRSQRGEAGAARGARARRPTDHARLPPSRCNVQSGGQLLFGTVGSAFTASPGRAPAPRGHVHKRAGKGSVRVSKVQLHTETSTGHQSTTPQPSCLRSQACRPVDALAPAHPFHLHSSGTAMEGRPHP